MRTILDRARKDIERSEVRRLVRVAVLDTGVDLEHSVFKQWRENGQLDVGLDLIDEESKMTDIDGHGTHVCHVFLKTAPNIKLYPVRVFRERQADASTPSLVAKVRIPTFFQRLIFIIFTGYTACRTGMGR
jgi:hypothetical protein